MTDEQIENEEHDDCLYQKYNMERSDFDFLISNLLELMNIGVSPLTQEVFIGFSDDAKGMWLEKKKYTSQFLNHAITFFTEGKKLAKGKSFQKDVIGQDDGKVEYTFTIKKP